MEPDQCTAAAYVARTNSLAENETDVSHNSLLPEYTLFPPEILTEDVGPKTVPETADVASSQLKTEPCKDTPGRTVLMPKHVPDMMAGGGNSPESAARELERTFAGRPVNFVEGTDLQLQEVFARCMRMNIEDPYEEATVYFHEGGELLNNLRQELAALPELRDLSPNADLTKANVGEPGETTPEMNAQLQKSLERHHGSFLGDGNAVPAPAKGVVCDLDVGEANPVAQRSRQIPPHQLQKVYDLLKKMLETGLVEYSKSSWASPIVIVERC